VILHTIEDNITLRLTAGVPNLCHCGALALEMLSFFAEGLNSSEFLREIPLDFDSARGILRDILMSSHWPKVRDEAAVAEIEHLDLSISY
jgi:hypothetical protein